MLFKERILSKGHQNVLGMHKSTLEITKDTHLTLKGDCILGIGIESNFLLSPRLIQLLKRDCQVTVKLQCGTLSDSFSGRGHHDLQLTHPHDLVFRKSEFIDERTALIKCDKSVIDIDRNIIKSLQDPTKILSLTYEVQNGAKDEIWTIKTAPKNTSIILKIIQKHDLLSKQHKVIHEPDHNIIPLSGSLNESVISEIENAIQESLNYELQTLDNVYPMDLLNLEEALQSEIPDELLKVLPKSFDVIGRVCIIELSGHEKDPLLNFKYIIARRLLSIIPSVDAIYMKGGNVSGTFRTRELEFLDGIDQEEATIVENGCEFRLKFKTTFFTPRLIRERKIISELNPVEKGLIPNENYTTLDMFTGIGPFAIQLAKKDKHTKIIGCDINPDAIEYANINASRNKVKDRVEFVNNDIRNLDLSKYGQILGL